MTKKINNIGMGFSIVERVPTPCGIFFSLCRGPQLNVGEKTKIVNVYPNYIFSVFPNIFCLGSIAGFMFLRLLRFGEIVIVEL